MQNIPSIALTSPLKKSLSPTTFKSSHGVALIPESLPETTIQNGTIQVEDLLSQNNDGTPSHVSNGNGAIATGAPVQLIFWGSAWNQPATSPSANDIINAVKNIFAGPFMSGLVQYGIRQSSFRGAIVVTSPEPPTIPSTFSDAGGNIEDIVNALINNGTFPEPDEDGGRNIYFVIMPPNTKFNTEGVGGAHFHFSSGSITDVDNAWCAWIGNGDIGLMTRVFGHELVETCTDPEGDGWTVDGAPGGLNEIGDICVGKKNVVNGILLDAYWSQLDEACLLPTEYSLKRFMRSKGFNLSQGIGIHMPQKGSVKAMMRF